MQITNIENGKKVIYIQQKNIKSILKYESSIPSALYTAAKNLSLSTDYGENDENFIRLEGTRLTNYISSLSWIPNYRRIKDLTNQEIGLLIDETKKQLDSLTKEYTSLSNNRKTYHQKLLTERSKLNEQIKDLSAIFWTRNGKYDEQITIPTIMDGEKIQFGLENNKYTLGSSLDGTKILLGKTDGTKYTDDDMIDIKELRSLIALYSMETGIITHEEGNGTMYQYTDPTLTYFITECTFIPTTDKKIPEDYLSFSNQQKEKRTPMQKLKSLFNHFGQTKKEC